MQGTLSDGKQQMSAIGQGVVSRPKLLLIYEFSLGLLPLLVDAHIENIEQIHRRRASFVLLQQDVQIALDHFDRGYVLETARITLSGESQDLSGNP